MSDSRTFVERALAGEILDVDTGILDSVEEWHTRGGIGSSGVDVPINEWLGMEREEYLLFVERADALESILMAHRYKLSLNELLMFAKGGSTSIAARSLPKDLDKVTAWLKKTRRL